MTRSALQFAVVREDACLDADIAADRSCRSALIVASGGCTALALAARVPELAITVVDPNEAQLAHLREKAAALAGATDLARFGVEDDSSSCLHERGNFERLFRLLRDMLDGFVIAADERRRRFEEGDAWDDVFAQPYWPRCFEVIFSDALLTTMFGPAATQHATPGSYPRYFQARIEDALRREDRGTNPYLHHILLGHYLGPEEAWPEYLRLRDALPKDFAPAEIQGTLLDVPDFGRFDFVQISNVMDWMDDASCRSLADRLCAELRSGAALLWRQLNDPRDLRALFSAAFDFDERVDADLTARDRSAFYDQIHLGLRH